MFLGRGFGTFDNVLVFWFDLDQGGSDGALYRLNETCSAESYVKIKMPTNYCTT